MNRQLADRLTEARARTLLLVAGVSDEDLRMQHDPLMGPIIWDLGHIAHFEQLWLLSNLEGEIRFGEMPGMFNPFENPRAVRGQLELPDRGEILEMLASTRARVLAVLAHADLSSPNALLRDGYVYRMVLQHEYQHNETMLQTLQLKQGAPWAPPRATTFNPPAKTIDVNAMVRFDGGRVRVGTADRSAAYDNERPCHEIELAPFEIDVAPVTNAQYLRFMEAGGYRERRWWSEAGWQWLQEAGVAAPKYWSEKGGVWYRREMNRVLEADDDNPVCHVCWHEAEAYARYSGKRLPTEYEWETAASWDAAEGRSRTYPWGESSPTALDANLDQLAFGTSAVGTFERNMSPLGCYGMIGDTWEWTSTPFSPYPGFEMFPYPEYSQVFFGPEYVVLRGGSWATRPGAIRASFRNWDYPIRRQIFSGFRCARDV